LRKSLDQNKDLKIDKVKKCCRKHCFGEYSRDFISEEQFKQFYVANNFSNTCSGCDTYFFFRINQFTYGKNYPLDKIKVGRFDLYRNDKLIGTQEDELESKKIVRSLKGFKKYFKTKNLKKREKFFKKNPSLIKGYTISERNLISDLWVSLKKNNEHKPSDLKEEELKNCIDKLPITHYCHCCKKNNLYHKYRNKIKKRKNFYLEMSSAKYNINHIEQHKLKLFKAFQNYFQIKLSLKTPEELVLESEKQKEKKEKK